MRIMMRLDDVQFFILVIVVWFYRNIVVSLYFYIIDSIHLSGQL